MAAVCPNINTKEWKTMVAHVGEREAYRAYIAHGNTIPNAISMTDLKKKVGLTVGRYSPIQQVKINTKIRRFNKENGTSHFVEYKPYGGNSFTATLNFNYLPVNKEAQAERDRRKEMQGYVGLKDAESFENVYDPSESEEEAGRFNEEGDFLPHSYFPATERRKLGPKFQRYIAEKEEDLRALYKSRGELLQKKRTDLTTEEKRAVSNDLVRVQRAIEKMEERLVELENLTRLGQIAKFAEEDMQTLERIFSNPSPKLSDLDVARRLIKVWQRAGDFSGEEPHIFYNPVEFKGAETKLKEVTDKFVDWRRQADAFNLRLIDLEEKTTAQAIKETRGFGPDIQINFNDPLPDIGFLVKNVLDISEVNNVMFQALHAWVKDANTASKDELDGIFAELDSLIDATGLTNFNIFQQTFGNKDTRLTGELVHRWTQDYFEWKSTIDEKRRNANNKANKMQNATRAFNTRVAANREYTEELRRNTIVVDPRIMFHDPEIHDVPAPTQEQKDAHQAELRELLGDRAYEEFLLRAKRKVEQYKSDLAAEISMIEAEFAENPAVGQTILNGWIAKHSPYVYAETMEKGYDNVTYNNQHVYLTNEYIDNIPKQKIDNKDSGFYDEKFQQIEDNESYLALYNHMLSLLKTMKLYLPNEKINFMQMNSIPTLKKKIGEVINSDGVAAGFQKVRDDMKESVRMDDLSQIGKPEEQKEFQLQMLMNNKARINDLLELRHITYLAEHGEAASADIEAEWRKDIINEIAQEKSFDLGRVMKAFSSMAVGYRHKSAIEEQVRMVQEIVRRSVEKRENAAGEEVRDEHGNILSDKGIKNLKEMLDNFLEVAYWGYPSNRPEGMGKKKLLTTKEKEMKALLEQSKEDLNKLLDDKKINQAEYEGRLDVIEDQLKVLGGVGVTSRYGDQILKYIQLKGMGWNVFAAFANLGFGFISNVIEGSDGRNYSMKNFWKAQALTLNSVGKNYTFNSWDGLSGNAKKIRVLMDKYDTLKEAKNEIYESSAPSLFKKIGEKLEWANPYSPQSRSEYANQAPVMIAIMMETKLTREDGTEISLWDAYNVDGTLKEGIKFTDEERYELKRIIDKLVKMNHGNYDPDSPLAAKRKFFGRAVSQFRTWAYQGFSERFRKEIKDFQLTNRLTGEDFVVRKGRYRSYSAYFHENNSFMGVGGVLDLTMKLLGKLVGINTNFDAMVTGEFTEADAANMRKNLTEIVLYMFITALTLALKATIDDDDPEKKKILAMNFTINQMARLSTDILFYTNPIEFERLFRNALPVFSLVVDSAKLIDSAWTLINDGTDVLQSGPSKGMSRTWRDFKKLVPGPAQAQKLRSASQTIYKK